MLVPRDRTSFSNVNRTMVRDAQGNFEIRGVAPGAYSLVATIYDGEKSLSGRVPVDVGGATVDNVAVTLAPPAELAGRIRVEGPATPPLSECGLTCSPRMQGA